MAIFPDPESWKSAPVFKAVQQISHVFRSLLKNRNMSLFKSLLIIMLAYSSMRNEEWGIWKQGISHVENRQEKRDQKSSILEAFGGGNDRKFKKKFRIQPSQP